MEQRWFSSYQEGIPHEINPSEHKSIVEILENSWKKYADRDAFTCMGKTFTYSEMDYLSKKFAGYLQNELGLKKGDCIALMMPNVLQYPIALFAALRSGIIVANVNPLYTAKELEHQLNDCGAKTIVIFANSCHVLEKIIKKTKVKNVITTGVGDLLGFPKSFIVNFVIKNVKKMIPAWNLPGHTRFTDALAKGSADSFKRVELGHEDLAFLQYTGGTTGVAKGAELTHKNIISNILQAGIWISPKIGEKEIIITPLPLYHIFSLTANCFVFSSIGAHNILITNPRDLPGFVKELAKYKFTSFTGVNTLFNALLNNEDFRKLDFSSLNLALGGGMAVQGSVAKEWKEVTGKPLLEAYGLTETSPAACMNPANLSAYNGMIGLPISSTLVKILDDDGKECPLGEAGELAVKGPQVMRGYWKRPEDTKKCMTSDGYFKTGDIATMDEKGFCKIVDRKKDMILVSGFNVYPNEVEDAAISHPLILEVAAVGVESETSGEIVKLFVIPKNDSLTKEEIIKHCRKELTGYKVPKQVEFRKELPKSPVGKILRKVLRDEERAKSRKA